MENEEILSEMFSAGADELSEADYQSQLMERLDTIIENQAYTSIQLQSVLEAQDCSKRSICCSWSRPSYYGV